MNTADSLESRVVTSVGGSAAIRASEAQRVTVSLSAAARDRSLSVPSVTLVYCGQTVGWIRMPIGVEVDLCPDHILLDGDPAPPAKKGAQQSPVVRPMSIVGTLLDGPRCHLVQR